MKKFTEILNEMSPKLIDPLKGSIKSNVEKYYKENKKKFKETNTKFLLKSGDNENGYYMFVKDEVVEYFVKYMAKNIPQLGKSTRQVLVQRFEDSVDSVGIPKIVFFEYLLPTFGSIVSDTEQTSSGKRFWEYAVLHAIKHSDQYDVYFIDRTKNIKTEIDSKEKFSEMANKIWGKENVFEYMLLAIVQK